MNSLISGVFFRALGSLPLNGSKTYLLNAVVILFATLYAAITADAQALLLVVWACNNITQRHAKDKSDAKAGYAVSLMESVLSRVNSKVGE